MTIQITIPSNATHIVIGNKRYELKEVSDFLAARATPAQPMSEHNARFAIDGAIQYGRENRNKPPSDDHWLMEYWLIGQQLRELGKTGWDNRTPLDPAERPSPSSVGDAIRAIELPEPFHDKVAIHGVPYYSEVYLRARLSEAAALAEQVQGQQGQQGKAVPGCRNQGGICSCTSGGSFGGCRIERGFPEQRALFAAPSIAQDGQKSEGV